MQAYAIQLPARTRVLLFNGDTSEEFSTVVDLDAQLIDTFPLSPLSIVSRGYWTNEITDEEASAALEIASKK